MLELRRMQMRRRYGDSSHAPEGNHQNPALLCAAATETGRSSPLPRECSVLEGC